MTPEERQAFAEALRRAAAEIPEVRRARIGAAVEVGVSYEARLGRPPYEYVAMLEFANLDDLRIYLNHPLHDALGTMFWNTCESTMILDADVMDAVDADLLK